MFRFVKRWNTRTLKQRPLRQDNRVRLEIMNLETRTLLSVMGPNTFVLDIPVAQVGLVVAEPANLNEIQPHIFFNLPSMEGNVGTTKLLADDFVRSIRALEMGRAIEWTFISGIQFGNDFNWFKDTFTQGNAVSTTNGNNLNSETMQLDMKNGNVLRRVSNQVNNASSQPGLPDSAGQLGELGNGRSALTQSNSSGSNNGSITNSGGQSGLVLGGSNSRSSLAQSNSNNNNGTTPPDAIRESARTNPAGDNSTTSTTAQNLNFILLVGNSPTPNAVTGTTPITPSQRVLSQTDTITPGASDKLMDTILNKETFKTAGGEEIPTRGRVNPDDREAGGAGVAGDSVAAMGLFDDLTAEDPAMSLQNQLDNYYLDDGALIGEEAESVTESNSVLASLGAILGGFWFTNFKKASESKHKRKLPRFYDWWKNFRG